MVPKKVVRGGPERRSRKDSARGGRARRPVGGDGRRCVSVCSFVACIRLLYFVLLLKRLSLLEVWKAGTLGAEV